MASLLRNHAIFLGAEHQLGCLFLLFAVECHDVSWTANPLA